MSARAFWITGRAQGEIRDTALPARKDGQLLLRSLYSGISRGSECVVFRGAVPQNQHQAMRAPHQDGDFPWPVKYGYSNVAVVEDGPAALAGRRVFCLHPHQTHYVVDEEDVVSLPEAVPPERAVLAANMETALNGLWDAAPSPGDRIAVVGGGTVGCLIAHLAAQRLDCRVQLVDIDEGKAEIATALGATFALPAEAANNCGLVFHASGQPAGLVTALSLAGFEATIVELSWFGDQLVPLPLGEDFHARRLVLRSSQVGHVAPARRADWSRRQRLAHAVEQLQDDRLDLLVREESAFEELPTLMTKLCDAPRGVLCHRIRYGT